MARTTIEDLELSVIESVKMYEIDCPESVVTTCYADEGESGDVYRVEAVSAADAAQKLYEEGWRNIEYEGYSSRACPSCLRYIKDNTDEENWNQLEVVD